MFKMILRTLVVFVLCCFLAQEVNAGYDRDGGYFYFFFSGEYILHNPDYIARLREYTYLDPSLGEGDSEVSTLNLSFVYDDTTGFSVSGGLGFDLGAWYALEFEGKSLVRHDVESEIIGENEEDTYLLKTNITAIALNLVVYRDFGDNLMPFLGVGVGSASVANYLDKNLERLIDVLHTKSMLQGFLGLNFLLTNDVSLYFKYTFLVMPTFNLETLVPDSRDSDVAEETGDVLYYDLGGLKNAMHLVGFGLRFMF